jgi:hypothetical protein
MRDQFNESMWSAGKGRFFATAVSEPWDSLVKTEEGIACAAAKNTLFREHIDTLP